MTRDMNGPAACLIAIYGVPTCNHNVADATVKVMMADLHDLLEYGMNSVWPEKRKIQ